MTRPLKFKRADVKRLVNAAKEAGLGVSKVEVTNSGDIIIHTKSEDETTGNNRWDKALGK